MNIYKLGNNDLNDTDNIASVRKTRKQLQEGSKIINNALKSLNEGNASQFNDSVNNLITLVNEMKGSKFKKGDKVLTKIERKWKEHGDTMKLEKDKKGIVHSIESDGIMIQFPDVTYPQKYQESQLKKL